ncbi:hypothetical protein DFH06DRAFT_1464757 [Mycena polygramma]|nr:hypothetical protein DFH06DRAFT_1464757 [Mycena polygramma]
MSAPSSASLYIVRLQAIPPSLYFLVPLATVVLLFLTVSHTVAQHRHDPVLIHIQLLDRRKRRVAWVLPVVFSLAILAILAGALRFFRPRSNSFALVVADSIVTAILYVELSVSVLYLLSTVADLGTIQPIILSVYLSILIAVLISATFVSIVASFKSMPPLLSPVLYLSVAILTMPFITFSFFSTLSSSEASLAPQITLSTTSSYPAFASEKPRMLDDVPSTPVTVLPAHFVNRTIPVYILCGQISAVVHFSFAIGLLVLLPDQSSPQSTLTNGEMTSGIWVEALVFRIIQAAFLVFWIICTMSAFIRLFLGENRSSLSTRASTLTTASDATAFTALPTRSHHPKSKSRSSSFSSPRPRRPPLPPRRSSPDDFQNLHDPFASPHTSRTAATLSPTTAELPEARATRMSAWGTLPPPPIVPPRPPPNVLVFNPPARRLPSLRNLRTRVSSAPAADSDVYAGAGGDKSVLRSMSFFSYTTPSAYSQDGEGDAYAFDAAFDVEEALLAQKLLRRLDAAGTGGWNTMKLKRNDSGASGQHL